jgi:hypothetical protein
MEERYRTRGGVQTYWLVTLAQLRVDSTAQALVTCFKYSLSLWEERKFLANELAISAAQDAR